MQIVYQYSINIYVTNIIYREMCIRIRSYKIDVLFYISISNNWYISINNMIDFRSQFIKLLIHAYREPPNSILRFQFIPTVHVL